MTSTSTVVDTAATVATECMGQSSRRQQILDQAAALFAHRGFHGVTIDEIGAAVATTGPALYRHFRSKESLLAELLLSTGEQLLSGSRELTSAHADDPAALLVALVEFHTAFALRRPELLRVYDHELPNLPDAERREVHTLQRCYLKVWVQALRSLHCALSVREAQIRTHADFALMGSTSHRVRIDNRRGQPANDPAEPASILHTMALAGLRDY